MAPPIADTSVDSPVAVAVWGNEPAGRTDVRGDSAATADAQGMWSRQPRMCGPADARGDGPAGRGRVEDVSLDYIIGDGTFLGNVQYRLSGKNFFFL